MKRICRTCKEEFVGEEWMNQCRECYKKFKGMPRIATMSQNKGVLIMTHPNVTKEEVDEWIKNKYGSVNDPSNWGAVEQGGYFKIWWNCQDDD